MSKIESNAECMNDCIHLKACRRIMKLAKNKGFYFSRHCDRDCSAYICGDRGSYCTVDEAWNVAVSQYDGSCDSWDVYAHCDFPSYNLNELIEGAYS